MATPTTAGTTAVRLGAAIRATREARGLSLRELARRIEVSPSFVSQIELGKVNPSVATLYALVGVLGTTLDDLIGDPDGEAPHGAGPGGVKAVAPTGSEFIEMELPEAADQVSVLGEKLTVMRPDGTDLFTSPGRPIATISNIMLEYRPGPAPKKK